EARDLIRTRRDSDTMLFPPPTQVYSPLQKDMSWTGLPEFDDDTITNYSRPSPSIKSNSSDLQNSDSSIFENGESSESIMSKPMIKFVKGADSPTVIKTNKVEIVRKPSIKYAKIYRNTSYDCGVWAKKGKNWLKNNFTHKNVTPRADLFKTASVSAARQSQEVRKELKARTSPTKIQKVDVRGKSSYVMAWVPKKFSTPTNNRLPTSSNTRNQAVIQDGRVDIQTKKAGYSGNGNNNAGRQSRNQAFNARNGNDDSNQIIQLAPQTESTLGKANV
nr:hypothetical protein [Tanacetum cinerariifolium]